MIEMVASSYGDSHKLEHDSPAKTTDSQGWERVKVKGVSNEKGTPTEGDNP